MTKAQNHRIVGDRDADYCLIQPIDQHDEELLDNEFEAIRQRCEGKKVMLAAFLVDDWQHDLSPWKAPAVFGKKGFGDGAAQTLHFVLNTFLPYLKDNVLEKPTETRFVIGGYSLAGLFALWAITQTTFFEACAATSPSVWFPHWTEYASSSHFHTDVIYLSLGNRENRAKNQLLAHVNEDMESLAHFLEDKQTTLEWNEGNHFVQSDLRSAKAFAWCINQLGEQNRK